MLLKNTFETIPFTEDIELRLSSFYKQFRPFGCTYMYYTVNDPNRGRIRFSTNTDWMKSYLEDGLTHVDPVKRICEQKKRGLSLHHEHKINRARFINRLKTPPFPLALSITLGGLDSSPLNLHLCLLQYCLCESLFEVRKQDCKKPY